MTEVRLPRLLDDNLLEITRLHPVSLSIDLSLSPMSTASMVVSRDEAEISVGQFVELFTAQGSAGIFIVKVVDDDPDRRQQNIQLNHGIDTLSNNLMEGDEEKTGTATALLSALLDCQTRRLWTLGAVEVPDDTTLRWECDYSNVLQSVVNLMEQLPTYALTLDQSGMPWVLGVAALREDDACECRLSRNLGSLSINIDKTNLCTRLFIRGIAKINREESYIPDVQPDAEGKLPPLEDYVLPPQEEIVDVYSATLEADTIGVWGVVDRVLEADQELPRDELIRQGEIYLEERKNPAVTVTLDAYDLHQATGEPFDRFYLGRICRVCLPEYGTVIRHRVVGLTYTDALNDPERVTVTLAAKRADGIDTIAGIIVNTAMLNNQVGRLQVEKIVGNEWIKIMADNILLHAKYIRLEADQIELIAKEILLQAEKIELQGKDILIQGEKIELQGKDILIQGEQIELNAKEILMQAEQIKMVADDVDINAENIRLWGEVIDEQGDSISRAEIAIDAANARIDLKADQLTVDDLGTRMTYAEVAIDGANAQIALKAGKEELNNVSSRVTTAEVLIDGLNADIKLKASQSEVTALESRVSTAEIDINGAEAAIALKASQSEVTALSERVTTAEVDINGAEAAIALKAEVLDALGERVTSAEVTINGLEGEIVMKADKIDLQGYVTADELEAEIIDVLGYADIENLSAGLVVAGTVQCTSQLISEHVSTNDLNVGGVTVLETVNTGPIQADSLSASTVVAGYGAFSNGIDIGSKSVQWKNLTVPVNLTGLTKTYTDLWYMDSDGSEQYARVLTNVELRMSGNYTYDFAVSA